MNTLSIYSMAAVVLVERTYVSPAFKQYIMTRYEGIIERYKVAEEMCDYDATQLCMCDIINDPAITIEGVNHKITPKNHDAIVKMCIDMLKVEVNYTNDNCAAYTEMLKDFIDSAPKVDPLTLELTPGRQFD